MANLSITNVCNKQCVYCFAHDTRLEYGQSYMEKTTFLKALEYLKRSELKQVRLLGGEPTLHPLFNEFVNESLREGFEILLFTNGLMTDNVLNVLASLPENKLNILLNTIHPNENNCAGVQRQKQVMAALRGKVAIGVNIYSSSLQLDYLLDYVTEYRLKKEIRLGISHSVLSRNNRYLHPKEYCKAGMNIVEFKARAQKKGISLGFDCGFVPCMFTADQFQFMSNELKKAGTCCHPIIDLLSDGYFISCYPLNNLLKVKLDGSITAMELSRRFQDYLTGYNKTGIYPYCTSCPLFSIRCNGGCVSFRIQRFIHDQNCSIQ